MHPITSKIRDKIINLPENKGRHDTIYQLNKIQYNIQHNYILNKTTHTYEQPNCIAFRSPLNRQNRITKTKQKFTTEITNEKGQKNNTNRVSQERKKDTKRDINYERGIRGS